MFHAYFPGERKNLLLNVKKQMLERLSSTKIHFEMASFAEDKLLFELCDLVVPFADSLGMNEQEIANLYNTMYYGNISLVADSTPRVATVLDQMRTLFKLIRLRSKSIANARELTRIHVHTLAYQAIFTVKNSIWKNTMAAAAKASLTAHRHVCASSNVSIIRIHINMKRNKEFIETICKYLSNLQSYSYQIHFLFRKRLEIVLLDILALVLLKIY